MVLKWSARYSIRLDVGLFDVVIESIIGYNCYDVPVLALFNKIFFLNLVSSQSDRLKCYLYAIFGRR